MIASVERISLEDDWIPCKFEDEDGHLERIKDLKNHAKASLGVARVLSQLLLMLNADKEFDHETLLEAAIACIDDQVLEKMLFSLVEEKLLLDVFIKNNENYLLYQKRLKEDSEAEISEMLNFERNRYDQLAEMEPILDLRVFNRLYIEWWYYTKEDDALLHLKLDHFLSMCEIIKENNTFDDVVGRLDLPERFFPIPPVLLKTAILRRIYRLKALSRIEPYEKFLGKAISKIVVEQTQDIHKSEFFLTSLNNELLEELHLLAEKYSLGEGEDILEGSLNHCNSILIKSRDLSCGIDEALAMFIKELKREVERQWFHDQAMGPVYFAALKKLQNEMELSGESLDEQLYEYKGFEVRNHTDEDEDEDEDEEVTEVLPISSSYDSSLEDITWVLKVLDDTLAVDIGMRHAFYPHFISLPRTCQRQHPICSDEWESAQQNIDFNWRRVDLLHKELLVKTSSSCLFFFEILKAMKLPQLTHVFQKISEGKGVEMKFEHDDKKLKGIDLTEIVGDFEKSKKNVLAHLSVVDFSKIGDSWQAIDLNQYHNLRKNLIDFAEAFCRAIKMKLHKHTVSRVKDRSRLNFVKEKLEDYQEFYRRDSRLREEDIVEMTKQKDAASGILVDLFYVKIVHDSIVEAAKGKLDLKENPAAYFLDTIQWLMYRNVATSNLMRLER